MSGTRIIGIALVRDEDLFVERAVRNVFGFCDELVLVDHKSRDGTPAALERLAAESPIPVSLHRIEHPPVSHDLIKGHAGEDAWVIGVDGDEIYDPRGLERFRRSLLAGELADRWLVRGNVLHCTALDEERALATGYLSPPAPSVTKLFNFGLITSWDGDNPERLHDASGLRFKPGASDAKYALNQRYSWEESPFRCLHVCFLRRSTRQSKAVPRINIPDQNEPRRLPLRIVTRASEALGFPEPGRFKKHYREGELVTVSVDGFLGA